MSRTLSLFAVAVSRTLAGCAGDTVLRAAPPASPEESDPGGGGGPGNGGWPGLPELPSGPWSQIDPGEMPDVHFVVAWGDVGCCYNCDGLYGDAGEDPDGDGSGAPYQSSEADIAYGCEVHYAIVDLFGQVIDEFDPPGQGTAQIYSHIDLQPSGPGRFLATAQSWGDVYSPGGDEPWPPPEDGPPQPSSWSPWVAWEVDALAGSTELVAWQDPVDYRVVIPGTGKRIDAGVFGVAAALDPLDPDWLYLHGARYGCASPAMPLRATHRRDASVLDRFWSAEEILGPDLGAFNWYPTGLAASIDEEGVPHLGLSLGDLGCSGAFQPVHPFVDLVPEEGPSWMRLGTEPWSTSPASWAPWNGGGAVQIEAPWELPRWHVLRADEVESGPAPVGLDYNVRPGPMLDPAGPTFALVGSNYTAPYEDRIVVMHGGEEVWSIDVLRFGLQERVVAMLDVVVLPPLLEE